MTPPPRHKWSFFSEIRLYFRWLTIPWPPDGGHNYKSFWRRRWQKWFVSTMSRRRHICQPSYSSNHPHFFLKNKSEKFPPNCICWYYHGVNLEDSARKKDDLANLSKLLLFCHPNPLKFELISFSISIMKSLNYLLNWFSN